MKKIETLDTQEWFDAVTEATSQRECQAIQVSDPSLLIEMCKGFEQPDGHFTNYLDFGVDRVILDRIPAKPIHAKLEELGWRVHPHAKNYYEKTPLSWYDDPYLGKPYTFDNWYHRSIGHSWHEGNYLIDAITAALPGYKVGHFIELMAGCAEMAIGVDLRCVHKRDIEIKVTGVDNDPHYEDNIRTVYPKLNWMTGDIMDFDDGAADMDDKDLCLSVIGNQSLCQFRPSGLPEIFDKFAGRENRVLMLNVPNPYSSWDAHLGDKKEEWRTDIRYTERGDLLKWSKGCFQYSGTKALDYEGDRNNMIELSGFWYQPQTIAVLARALGYGIKVFTTTWWGWRELSLSDNVRNIGDNVWIAILPRDTQGLQEHI